MEARIYAEDPLRSFLPSTGPLLKYVEPKGASIRVDSGVKEGHLISSHYDPMISKLIVHAHTRSQAIEKLVASIDRYAIHGVGNNKSFLSDVCRHPEYIKGNTPTNFLQTYYPDGFTGVNLNIEEKCEFAAIMVVFGNYRREILGQPPLPLEESQYEDDKEDEGWSDVLDAGGELLESAGTGENKSHLDEPRTTTIVAIGGMFGEKYAVSLNKKNEALVHSLDLSAEDNKDQDNGEPVPINIQGLRYNSQSPLVEYRINGEMKTLQVGMLFSCGLYTLYD